MLHITYTLLNTSIYITGGNDNGILGSTVVASTSFQKLQIQPNTTDQIIGNRNYSFILSNNQLYASGESENFELGMNNASPIYSFTRSDYFANISVQSVGVGWAHTIVLSSDGKVFTQGDNQYGQLGRGSDPRPNIVDTSLLNGTIIQVGAVQNLSYILTNESLYYFGQCTNGLCGSVINNFSAPTLFQLPGFISKIEKIKCFEKNVVIVDDQNYFYGLGDTNNYQLCNQQPVQYQTALFAFGNTNQIKDVKIGKSSTLFLMENGDLFYCGQNYQTQKQSSQMTSAALFNSIVDFAVQDSSWMVLTSTSLYYAGSSPGGQAGITSTNQTTDFVQVSVSAVNVNKLFANGEACIMYGDGLLNLTLNGSIQQQTEEQVSLYVAGMNNFGQLCTNEEQYSSFTLLKFNLSSQLHSVQMNNFSTALVADQLYATGSNSQFGTFGLYNTQMWKPTLLKQLQYQQFKSAFLSDSLFIGLTNSNKLFTAGDQTYNKTANQFPCMAQASLDEIIEDQEVVAVGSVMQMTFLASNTTLYVIGQCYFGLCGNMTGTFYKWTPVPLLDTITRIVNALFFKQNVAIVDQNGYFWASGGDYFGQLCRGDYSISGYFDTYVKLPMTGIRKLSMSAMSTEAVLSSGSVYFCGRDFRSSISQVVTPMKLTLNTVIIDAYASEVSWLFLSSSQLFGVGQSVNGSLGIGSQSLAKITPIVNISRVNRIAGYGNSVIVYYQYTKPIVNPNNPNNTNNTNDTNNTNQTNGTVVDDKDYSVIKIVVPAVFVPLVGVLIITFVVYAVQKCKKKKLLEYKMLRQSIIQPPTNYW